MLNKIIIGLFLFFLAIISHARPNPDKIGICYLFQDDTLKDRGVCIISTGSGAGGEYINLDFNKKDYLFEFQTSDLEDKLTYLRDSRFYHKITPELMSSYEYEDEDILLCYKDKPFDICYQVPKP